MRWGWLATVGLPLGFWWLVHWLDATTLRVGIAPLVDAEFIASSDTSPPTAAAGWERRAIPDDWQASAREVVEGWYRLSFHADAPADDWAVYLPVVHMNAAAWVNGRFVGDGGRFAEPVARNWNRPLLFSLPPGLVGAGRNTLYVRVKADRAGRGLLGPVYVAPRRLLQAAYAHRRLFAVQFLRATAVCQVVVFLFVAALGLQRPNDTVYRWAALAAFAWMLTWPFVLVVDPPVPTTAWYWLCYVAAGWFTLLAARFVLAFIGESSARANRWILGYGVVGSATLIGLAAIDSSLFHAAAHLGVDSTGVPGTRVFHRTLPRRPRPRPRRRRVQDQLRGRHQHLRLRPPRLDGHGRGAPRARELVLPLPGAARPIGGRRDARAPLRGGAHGVRSAGREPRRNGAAEASGARARLRTHSRDGSEPAPFRRAAADHARRAGRARLASRLDPGTDRARGRGSPRRRRRRFARRSTISA